MSHDHARFAALVTDAITHDREIAANELTVAQRCVQCAPWLDAVAVALEARAPVSLSAEVEVKTEARASSVARRMWQLWTAARITTALALGAFVFFILEWAPILGALWYRGGSTGGGSIAKTTVATVITCSLLYLGAVRRDRGDKPDRLYARWEGRQLQGVCVGVARYFAAPVWLVRLAFVAMTVLGLGGFSVYLALACGIGFHPDDRKHFLYFRIARWFRRRRGATV